jgi:hypothetical protein
MAGRRSKRPHMAFPERINFIAVGSAESHDPQQAVRSYILPWPRPTPRRTLGLTT